MTRPPGAGHGALLVATGCNGRVRRAVAQIDRRGLVRYRPPRDEAKSGLTTMHAKEATPEDFERADAQSQAVVRAREPDSVGLSVVIPVYNEVDNLVALLDELAAVFASMKRPFEVIVVDDGSNDGTAPLLRKLTAERVYLKGIFFRRNFGQTAAFDAGFREASGEIVVTIDGDLQNDPNDIPAMVDMLEEGYDLVAGWRRNRQDGMFLRKVPSRIANWLIRKVTGTRIHDLGCSLRVYRREITEELRLYGEMHRFISILADNMGARIAEMQVNHRPRRAGASKYGLRRSVKVILDLLTVMFLRRYQTKPTYVFGGIGLLMMMLAVALSGFVLWEKWHDGVWVHRNPLFILAAIAGLIGVQLLATGLLAELIIRTYYESQDKRAYSVASRAGFDRVTRD
jgi:glycosyltransferase involved in cell wall biosynthesis